MTAHLVVSRAASSYYFLLLNNFNNESIPLFIYNSVFLSWSSGPPALHD